MEADMAAQKTAGIVIIGDEILSGRTTDTNFNTIAVFLGELGIAVREGRTVADSAPAIIEAVNTLRARYDYIFTTGGIGPTHDDITAEAVAQAFGVPLEFNAEAMALLGQHYSPDRFNDARKRMARAPVGATLVDNPISVAPGFMIGNVIVMAGIPAVVEGMLQSVRPRLVGGPKMLSSVVTVLAPEGDIAGPLGDIQSRHAGVMIGSYPSFAEGKPRVRIVLRTTDEAALSAATHDVEAIARAMPGAN
jgi:molybdenum cofactor synthesis domain-containing protein